MEPVSPRVDTSLVLGLEFLATQQQANGSFQEGGPKLAITALSAMAFMASGHAPGDGRYGPTVRKAIDYLIASFPADGYVGRLRWQQDVWAGDHHACIGRSVWARARSGPPGEAQDHPGFSRQSDPERSAGKEGRESCRRLAPYEPNAVDSDLSLSGWNALALRSCNNIGISVPREAIDKAAGFVLRCYRKQEKGFAYQPYGAPSPAMTGVGILNLCLMDRADAPEVAAASSYLSTINLNRETRFTYYTFYYATHAAYQLGDPFWVRHMEGDQRELGLLAGQGRRVAAEHIRRRARPNLRHINGTADSGGARMG